MQSLDFFVYLSEQLTAWAQHHLVRPQRRRGSPAKPPGRLDGPASLALKAYRVACEDFDREVTNWPQAALEQGGRL